MDKVVTNFVKYGDKLESDWQKVASENPLNPPAVADALPAIDWLKRIKWGSVIGLALMPISFLNVIAMSYGNTRTNFVFQVIVLPLLALGNYIAGWLHISSEPKNEEWLRLTRIMVRALIVFEVIRIVLRYAVNAEGYIPTAVVTMAKDMYVFSDMTGSMFFTAINFYMSNLGKRLKDNVLRVNFNIFNGWVLYCWH